MGQKFYVPIVFSRIDSPLNQNRPFSADFFCLTWKSKFLMKLLHFENLITGFGQNDKICSQKAHILAQNHWFPTWKSRFSLSDSYVWSVITLWWEKVRSKTRYLGPLAPRAAFARAIFIVGKHSPNRSNLASKLAELGQISIRPPMLNGLLKWVQLLQGHCLYRSNCVYIWQICYR